jgi:hypothetical protein
VTVTGHSTGSLTADKRPNPTFLGFWRPIFTHLEALLVHSGQTKAVLELLIIGLDE